MQLTVLERLELDFLELAGLIPSSALLGKKIVRNNTANTYKQHKFNLLREESEGYSKLVIELSIDLPIASDPGKVALALRNIQALIGYFDLDPNRVLDIIFDALISNITSHWQFFIDLLLNSPWRPRKNISNNESGAPKQNLLPRPICGQLMGFKFAFFNLPDNTIIAPKNLYLACAILIKHEIVLFSDIYSFLGPSDENMEKEKELYEADLIQKVKNAGRFSSVGVIEIFLVFILSFLELWLLKHPQQTQRKKLK